MDKAKITEALKKLDVKNDRHWTKEGQPILSMLSIHAGGNVTREEADAAAKDFTRETATDYFTTGLGATGSETNADKGNEGGQLAEGDEPKDATGAGVSLNVTGDNPGSHPLEKHPRADDLQRDKPNTDANGYIAIGDPLTEVLLPGAAVSPAAEAAAEIAENNSDETVESLLEELAELNKRKDELVNHIASRQQVYDMLVTVREVENSDPEAATRQYIAAQQEARVQRGQKLKDLQSMGMTPSLMKGVRETLGGAPIDSAARGRKTQQG